MSFLHIQAILYMYMSLGMVDHMVGMLGTLNDVCVCACVCACVHMCTCMCVCCMCMCAYMQKG